MVVGKKQMFENWKALPGRSSLCCKCLVINCLLAGMIIQAFQARENGWFSRMKLQPTSCVHLKPKHYAVESPWNWRPVRRKKAAHYPIQGGLRWGRDWRPLFLWLPWILAMKPPLDLSTDMCHNCRWWEIFIADWAMFAIGCPIFPVASLLLSGNLTVCYWKWPIEIVDLPNLKMVIFHSYVSLPEGINCFTNPFAIVISPINHRVHQVQPASTTTTPTTAPPVICFWYVFQEAGRMLSHVVPQDVAVNVYIFLYI